MNDKRKLRRGFIAFLFLLPAIIMITFCSVIPLGWNVVISFLKWNGMSESKFVGFENYVKIFTTRATKHAIANSFAIAIIALVVAMLLGLLLALLIYKVSNKEAAVFRFVFYSPTMLPLTVVGLLFTFVFAMDDGILNNLLAAIGAGGLAKAWLSTKTISIVCIGIVQGWRFAGTVMMLIYTAMLGLPGELYEDAKLSGATYWEQIRFIILPMIRPTIMLTMSMVSVWTFKTYDIVEAMTGGGPGDLTMTAPMYVINRAFMNNDYGYASAVSIVFAIMIMVVIGIIRNGMRGETIEY
ncbi:carbohydrate ABC transporter permease [Ruminococcus sp. 5_1_39BFAA]|uniref:carbohydrate ABC transporter permease n=1 Tax=Ruminococcus sp. 5_1_39BFAA TaxID=457412 RepID=UPI003566F0CC